MKAMKCYCCEQRLVPVVDGCYRTVIPNPKVEGGKEVICQNCAELVCFTSREVDVNGRLIPAFEDCLPESD